MTAKLNEAGVIVLHEQNTDSIILTQRSHELIHHPGEICFPGGRRQAEDRTLYQTALRELHEELAIQSDRVHLQKNLRAERTLSGFIIHPWLASIDDVNPFQANEAEVVDVIWLPMSRVRDRRNYKETLVEHMGIQFLSWQFIDEKFYIWGATVRIMMQLCEASIS